MPSAEVEVQMPASADSVWKIAGGFLSVADWHPAVGRVDDEGKGRQRRLHLVDGGQIVEALLQHDAAARAYSYRLVEAPLPIENYQATFYVEEDGAERCLVRWSARFDVKEGEDVLANEQALEGIFESGLQHLKQLSVA
jgi:hypothetical protein